MKSFRHGLSLGHLSFSPQPYFFPPIPSSRDWHGCLVFAWLHHLACLACLACPTFHPRHREHVVSLLATVVETWQACRGIWIPQRYVCCRVAVLITSPPTRRPFVCKWTLFCWHYFWAFLECLQPASSVFLSSVHNLLSLQLCILSAFSSLLPCRAAYLYLHLFSRRDKDHSLSLRTSNWNIQ